ncbi:MAG TPA: trypsin-like peptidase domain-containing protein [Vicinamibacterales bacterium]|nr:trypsin-like peptidase domain-containing protein [Vicinamibacterales bacterium]
MASTLTDISNQLADAVAAVAPSVIQVHGRRQPASGVVLGSDLVVTTTRAIGQEDGLSVRTPDAREIQAELIGWDPATHLVALRVPELSLAAAPIGAAARVGHIGIAIGRSWSNSLTASTGTVSVMGGPLPTGRGRAMRIEEIIRTTAPMHRGFAGGAFVNTDGQLLGIATATEIRGLGVVIPAAIVTKTIDSLVKHGRAKRRYLGVAGQGVPLAVGQRPATGQASGVLIVRVMDGSPAEKAGLLVGDILIAIDGQELESPDRLLDALASGTGPTSVLRVLRGGSASDIVIEVGEK